MTAPRQYVDLPPPHRWIDRRVALAMGLTERHAEILALAASGRSNRAIGSRLHLTEDTVKTHLRGVYRKIGARDRAHAVAICYDRGLLLTAVARRVRLNAVDEVAA